MNLNSYAAGKLARLLILADTANHLTGETHEAFLRKHVRKYKGQARKEIERVIALGPDIPTWMKFFFEEIRSE